MATVFSDDFNRPNESLDVSANWDGDFPGGSSGIQVSSNTVYLRSGGLYAGSCMVATSAATLTEKQASSVTFTTVANNAGGPFVRGTVAVAGQFDGYGAEVLPTEIRLYKYTTWNYNGLAGSPSRIQIGSTYTATINNGDIVKVEAIGSAIKVYVNGTERISTTDATHTTGQPGVFVTSTGAGFAYIDDYEAIELTPVAGGGSPLALGIDGSWNRNMGHP
jgi:hypothetical protein